MHIKRLILEDFKSYGGRVELNDFHPGFNAITGQNGAGKSNVMDALCFVFGITRLNDVRVQSVQEFVHKGSRGQATKASVTLVFDNTKSGVSPVGFEGHREITICKQVELAKNTPSQVKVTHMLNGTTVTQKRIADVLNSVHLNVNNPHFLVMQMTVNNLASMKPLQFLALIEEAAGTRVFDSKKVIAERTILRKDEKLNQLNYILEHDIGPLIARLREQREDLTEYQRLTRVRENLEKIVISSAVLELEEKKAATEKELKKEQEAYEDWNRELENISEEVAAIESQVKVLRKTMKEEDESTGAELQNALRSAESKESDLSAELKAANADVKSVLTNIANIKKIIEDDEKLIKSKENDRKKLGTEYESAKEEQNRLKEELEKAQERYEAISRGLYVDEDGKIEGTTIENQLIEARKMDAQTRKSKDRCSKELAECKKMVEEKKARLKKVVPSSENREKINSCNAKIKKIKGELSALNYEEGTLEKLEETRRAMRNDIPRLQKAVDDLYGRVPRLKFKYDDPEPNWDRGRVRGPVAEYFRVKESKFYTAIECYGGIRLFHIIVEDEQVSRAILANCKLQSRVTFLPMARMMCRFPITENEYREVKQKYGEGRLWPMMSLIDFNPEYKSIMEYMFGDVYVSADAKTAHALAYESRIRRKTITLQGDIYDPSGVIHGGKPQTGSNLLHLTEELKKSRAALAYKEQLLKQVEHDIEKASRICDRYNELKHSLQLVENELVMCEKNEQDGMHYRLTEEVRNLEGRIAELTDEIKSCAVAEKEFKEKVKKLEAKISNKKNTRDTEQAAARKAIDTLTKQLNTLSSKWEKSDQLHRDLEVTVENLRNGIEKRHKQIEEEQAELKKREAKIEALTQDHRQLMASIADLQNRLSIQNEKRGQRLAQIQTVLNKHGSLNKQADNIKLEQMKCDSRMKKLNQNLESLQQTFEKYKQKNPSIVADRDHYGERHTAYDFSKKAVAEARAKLPQTIEKLERLSRKLGSRATLGNLANEEEQYNKLVKKKNTVQEDKEKIQKMMQDLEGKKKSALECAWIRINDEFAVIFDLFLKGCTARLVPLPGKTMFEGLQPEVCLNKDVKTLTELSGGQKSLMALAFILAMLRFQPAPVYLLDEVDAALDVAHTENVGHVLSNYFRGHQFIVISLKDGLYNHADVLFIVEFRDGCSRVIRKAKNKKKLPQLR